MFAVCFLLSNINKQVRGRGDVDCRGEDGGFFWFFLIFRSRIWLFRCTVATGRKWESNVGKYCFSQCWWTTRKNQHWKSRRRRSSIWNCSRVYDTIMSLLDLFLIFLIVIVWSERKRLVISSGSKRLRSRPSERRVNVDYLFPGHAHVLFDHIGDGQNQTVVCLTRSFNDSRCEHASCRTSTSFATCNAVGPLSSGKTVVFTRNDMTRVVTMSKHGTCDN